MSVDWEARRRRIAEFKVLNASDITPALVAEKAQDLVHRYREAAISQAAFRGQESSTAKVRAFWAAVAAHLADSATK